MIQIHKPPECVDIICSTSRGFMAGALKARVRRTSTFRAPGGKNQVMYGELCQYARVFLNLLYTKLKISFNPLSPKIDFYVDLLLCATSWASNHKFMLLSKIFQETYYI